MQAAPRGSLLSLRAGGLTVEELKSRLRSKEFGDSDRASKIGAILADFLEQLEKVMDEDLTEEEGQHLKEGMAEVIEKVAPPEPDMFAEGMLAELGQLDPRVSKDDYFDDSTNTWDVEGLKEDLTIAQQRLQEPPETEQPAQQPPPQTPEHGQPSAEQLFSELQSVSPSSDKEDYFDGEHWDMQGLMSDLALAKGQPEKADFSGSPSSQVAAAQQDPPPAAEVAAVEAVSSIKSGDSVLAHCADDGYWHSAVAETVAQDSAKVKWYEDGSFSTLPLTSMKLRPPVKAGSKVRAIWSGDGGWYYGTVMKANGDGSLVVKYDEDGSQATVKAQSALLYEDPPKTPNAAQAPAKPQAAPAQQAAPVKSATPAPQAPAPSTPQSAPVQQPAQVAPVQSATPAPQVEPSPAETVAVVEIKVGDTVLADCSDDGNWHSAVVTAAEGSDSFKVKWKEDGSAGVVAKTSMKLQPPTTSGSKVRAVWSGDGGWYYGVVVKDNGDGTFAVKYDEDQTQANVKAESVHVYEEPPKYWFAPVKPGDPAPKVGEAAQARWTDGGYYGVVVQRINGDGTVTVKWDEDSSEGLVQLTELRTSKPRISSDTFSHGQQATGVVVRIVSVGAFVDIGVEKEGLVHISKLSDSHVNTVNDVVEEGQEVNVWFIRKAANGNIDLTMTQNKLGDAPRADPSVFANVPSSTWFPGKVVNLMNFGAFVEVTQPDKGVTTTGMVHVSEIRDGFIARIEDELSLGQAVQVRVVSAANGKLSLSMKPE